MRRLWLVAMGLAAGLVFVTRVAGLIAIPIFALYLVALHARGVDSRWPIVDSETEGRASTANPFYRPSTIDHRLSTIDYRLLARDLALYAAGVLPSLVVNAAYNLARFGKPLQLEPHGDASFGYPPWLGLPNLLVSPGKGLLWYTPAVLLLVLAARPFWRRCPWPAVLFALIGGAYLLFYANVNYWHGDPAWGPRYLYATLPYLVLPLGEVFARWRGYRRPLRAALVGVLALSFLVQFSATTVSYWRSFHYVFANYPDQVDRYAWGFNMNYFWTPAQSPVLLSLGGVADITQKYVDGAPLVRHTAGEHLGSGNESCLYPVYQRAVVCLTDIDDLRSRASFNTFTLWWLHTYPWWPLEVVTGVALALLALFLGSGAALLRLTARSAHIAAVAPPGARAIAARGSGRETVRWSPGAPGAAAALPVLRPPRLAAASAPARGTAGTHLAEPQHIGARTDPAPTVRSGVAFAPLALAALTGLLIYAGIAVVGAATAPRHPAPLVRMVAMGRTVVDGGIAYRVLGITRPSSALDTLYPAGRGQAYAVVRLWLRNLSPRRRRSIHRTNFMLSDAGGDTMYQWPCWVPVSIDTGERPSAEDRKDEDRETRDAAARAAHAQSEQASCPLIQARYYVDPAVALSALYHLQPAWYPVPPRAAVQRVLVYVVPVAARRFALLGPGIALTRLSIALNPAPAVVARVVSLLLGIRREPRADALVVEWLAQGTELRVDGHRGAWVAVMTAEGLHGWAPRRYVR